MCRSVVIGRHHCSNRAELQLRIPKGLSVPSIQKGNRYECLCTVDKTDLEALATAYGTTLETDHIDWYINPKEKNHAP